ncbi:MAG TPA: dipeptide/oligopeptide/nickel ABC transporter ATP-binding protein, partial [Terriglobales bacterium]|nr:dipeptide/oligopeptide/nickel ABC transporter ATP-binding protein [Terriglobales bacterium]
MAAELVRALNIRKTYRTRHRFSSKSREVVALDGVTLSIPHGTTVALTGPSGSGKSTLGRCIARLEEPTSGEIWFEEQKISELNNSDLLPFRRKIQFIFQDAGTALNPRFSASEIVEEPLVIAGFKPEHRRRRALELMDKVQLSSAWADRRPSEFSGGQRQRLAIARALSLEPQLLILDEALSSVDVSIQAQLVNLLLELQSTLGLTYLFISHDLASLPHIADRVAIMRAGRLIELCASTELVRHLRNRGAHT